VAASLLEALDDVGLQGRSVLDVGCGAGELALATLVHGAARAHGIDLGPGAIDHARALANDRGLTERATFEVGDGSSAPLPRADVVVLNRVVCCSPDLDALLINSTGAAGTVYALTAPVDRGPAGAWNRASTWCSNRWFSLRRRKFGSFRAFVYPVDRIDRTVRDAGFVPVRRERRRVVWELVVYGREVP
jgi:magnesium-protoporphyrin O-methyltransferase